MGFIGRPTIVLVNRIGMKEEERTVVVARVFTLLQCELLSAADRLATAQCTSFVGDRRPFGATCRFTTITTVPIAYLGVIPTLAIIAKTVAEEIRIFYGTRRLIPVFGMWIFANIRIRITLEQITSVRFASVGTTVAVVPVASF